ncbi:MAG: ATP-binding protein [Actinobacteria bacterium]|nr:ATP-binding protein [Actinomycetota bacterium]MBI3687267.1 ATP-binding protein [Actinomycetota bacterium]
MTEFVFAPATKEQAKARVALAGPSGSGKTYTALTLASHFAERFAVIDTERGSASKYADEFNFDTLRMTKFDPRDLIQALAAAQAGGYGCTVVDSMSHFWMGAGGMLELVDAAAKRSAGGNSFGGWKEARPHERRMIDALLAYDGHVIVTMRTKTEYVVEEDARGKKVPRKVGLKPEQRDGIEYEFDIVGDLDLENTLVVTKSRCRALSGAVINRPGQDLAEQVLAWLGDGKPAPAGAVELRARILAEGVTAEALRGIYGDASNRNLLNAAVVDADGTATTLRELLIVAGNAARVREAGEAL